MMLSTPGSSSTDHRLSLQFNRSKSDPMHSPGIVTHNTHPASGPKGQSTVRFLFSLCVCSGPASPNNLKPKNPKDLFRKKREKSTLILGKQQRDAQPGDLFSGGNLLIPVPFSPCSVHRPHLPDLPLLPGGPETVRVRQPQQPDRR